jgi:hypothetical protein
MKVIQLKVKIYPEDWNILRFTGNVVLILLYYDTLLFSLRGVMSVWICAYACVCVWVHAYSLRKEGTMDKERKPEALLFYIFHIAHSPCCPPERTPKEEFLAVKCL